MFVDDRAAVVRIGNLSFHPDVFDPDICNPAALDHGRGGNTRFPEKSGDLPFVVDPGKVPGCVDSGKKLDNPADEPRGISGGAQKRHEEGGLIGVVAALLSQCFFRPFHTPPVPLGFDIVFDPFVNADGIPVTRFGQFGNRSGYGGKECAFQIIVSNGFIASPVGGNV